MRKHTNTHAHTVTFYLIQNTVYTMAASLYNGADPESFPYYLLLELQ